MTIQNTVNKNKYVITPQEWDVIQNNGNAYKYVILDDGAPVEVKSMRAKEVKTSLQAESLEVKITKKVKNK